MYICIYMYIYILMMHYKTKLNAQKSYFINTNFK